MSSNIKQLQFYDSFFFIECIYDFFNKRLKVEDYRGNIDKVIQKLNLIISENSFEKIIIKSRYEHINSWISQGYVIEATIPNYFNGSTAFIFVSYHDKQRQQSEQYMNENHTVQTILQMKKKAELSPLSSTYLLRKATAKDADSLAGLYRHVFTVYPTPLHDELYIRNILLDNHLFYVIEHNGFIVSAASAEINETYHNAELTDCATLPEHRKAGLMKHLLKEIETGLQNRQIYSAYTLSRALSFGMNAVFYQLGYTYTGRLMNNCYIYDKLEDMNVWAKDLSTSNN
ncbi:putative beta-lysine N-acetyltransferase [Priestia megaterium]|nr:putative beta-lysine N-acetyltransferase [Priestia megaterium]